MEWTFSPLARVMIPAAVVVLSLRRVRWTAVRGDVHALAAVILLANLLKPVFGLKGLLKAAPLNEIVTLFKYCM